MTDIKHTPTHSPLPWKVSGSIDGSASVTVCLSQYIEIPKGYGQDFGSRLYFATNGSNPSLDANAAFIVKACNSFYEREELIREMVAALEGSVGALEFSLDFHRDLGNADISFAADKLDAVTKAITKAKGAINE